MRIPFRPTSLTEIPKKATTRKLARTAMVIAAAATLLSAACGGVPKRGKVVTKIDERESVVRLRELEVREGDTVQILGDRCPTTGKGPVSPNCSLQPIGKGVVVRIIDSNEVAVRADPGVAVRQGDVVQKVIQ